MTIHTNFIRPKAPILYREAIVAMKDRNVKYNHWKSGLGNKSYEMWRIGRLIIAKQHYDKDIPIPVGHE